MNLLQSIFGFRLDNICITRNSLFLVPKFRFHDLFPVSLGEFLLAACWLIRMVGLTTLT